MIETPIPLKLPAGMFKNGTQYQARGRWWDGNRVRWHDGALRPIGGWERRTLVSDGSNMPSLVADAAAEKVRDSMAWTDLGQSAFMAFGSNLALYAMNAANEVTTITPVGFVGSPPDPSFSTGYGRGPYNIQTYGTPRNLSGGEPDPVYRWQFDTWGQDLIAASMVRPGSIYAYSPGDPQAAVIPNAPTDAMGAIVTDQRIVMCIRPGRIVQWSDRENREQWTPAVDNEAGDFPLTGNGDLLAITKVLNQVLILSETDAHVGRFIGSPFVYGFDRVGENCAPIHPSSVITEDRFAMWLGERNFWMYDGTLREVPCDVIDYVFETLSRSNSSKISAYTVAGFSEITWLYQSVSGTDIDSYVTFDWKEGHWTVGKLDRTTGEDSGVFNLSIMVDLDGTVWNHEIPSILAPDVWAETGPLETANGQLVTNFEYVMPDTEAFGAVNMTFYGRDMPTQPEYTYGPYVFENPTCVRVDGRQIRMRIDGVISDWEVGDMRIVPVAPALAGVR